MRTDHVPWKARRDENNEKNMQETTCKVHYTCQFYQSPSPHHRPFSGINNTPWATYDSVAQTEEMG